MEKIKVIFLDIDGVLNVYSHDHDQFGSQFHKHLVENLRRVVDETGAKIVISSTWRFSGLQVMKEMWEKRNLPGEVIDITPDLTDIYNEENFEWRSRIERGYEVEYWLNHHPEVERYVIFDDDDDFLDHQRGNFVRTANNINHPDCVAIGYGLTSECANRAIRILNG